MLLNEFINEMKKYGIPLNLLNFHINEVDKSSYSTYILHEEGKWSIYEADERNNVVLYFSGDENSAFQEPEDDDYCYECGGYGDDYSYDEETGELVSNCDNCPYNGDDGEDN